MIEAILVERCDGCGACKLACVQEVIGLDEVVKKAFLLNQENCSECYNCSSACATEAIVIRSSV